MRRWMIFAVLAGAVALAQGPAPAEHTALPEASVALVVSGAIAGVEAPGEARFDLAALREFPVREIRTTTYWHVGVQRFRGISALAVLKTLGVEKGKLALRGRDGYEVELPMAALHLHEPILAMEWEGESIVDEAEGPLWLIFPYDRMSAEERERYTAWSVWALEEIRVGH